MPFRLKSGAELSDEWLFGQFHDNSFVRAGLKYTF